jgi:hypothetical protein
MWLKSLPMAHRSQAILCPSYPLPKLSSAQAILCPSYPLPKLSSAQGYTTFQRQEKFHQTRNFCPNSLGSTQAVRSDFRADHHTSHVPSLPGPLPFPCAAPPGRFGKACFAQDESNVEFQRKQPRAKVPATNVALAAIGHLGVRPHSHGRRNS